MQLLTESLTDIRNAIQSGAVKSADVVQASLERAKKFNPELNCFISLNEKALDRAKEIDAAIAQKKNVGILAGVPIAIKDNYCTKGLKTTAASKILGNFIPPYSATVVERLEAQGAIVIGKTNLDEFAMGSTNENSFFGPVKNPLNKEYVPGGSSGGSAAAVAAQIVPGATGSDTGGSIRLPSHYCGITGMKPTYGRVSRYGIVAFASSLDQAGPMGVTVNDCALMLEGMAGFDPKDSTTSEKPVPQWSANIRKDLRGLKVGLPKEFFVEGGMDPQINTVVMNAKAQLKDMGVTFVDIELPLNQYAVAVYYIICTSEASSNLARYDGVKYGYRNEQTDLEDMYCKTRGEGFGTEVKRRIMIGTYALSSGYYEAYYRKACQVRRLIQKDYLTAFSKCDVIFGPVSTSAAFRMGEKKGDPLKMYLNDIYTTSVNLAGLPGMSVPAGFTSEGLPVGVQLIAPQFAEQTLFDVGQHLENSLKLKRKAPYVGA
ncbi:MAG: Asp-tRNA(Asn)/Glu-tRNA(Gln) amidotransferase subunit GatA [Bdellovibrionales bacterium]|nr:Asp-tRNA(Asn)/Glu-tRNA(Gln) amidotransferase subunit GatA [Bdellovibrionales bacterium]